VTLGPRLVEGGAEFGVWAPRVRSLAVRAGGRTVPMEREDRGVWRGSVEGVAAGDDYLLVLDGERERPDPRSRFQPHGVHGPSRLVDLGPPPDPFAAPAALKDLVFYELHCGTFTPEGTFDAAIGRLGHLAALGVNAVEVMPVAAFPGSRGWGYDGVDLYAVHAAYGGPAGFRRFVDACHEAGLAVVLDVVYNHLGPDGNYLAEFGPYFSDITTDWGPAVNLDGPGSDFVRGFVLDNAEQWVAGYGVDGLRLDAVQALYDRGSVHILEELATRVHTARPGSVVVAESDLHQPLLVTAYGIDAMWADDLHHALHVAITGETSGWYEGFTDLSSVAKALETGWVFTGQYSPHLDRRHGRDPAGLGGERFVVCTQNHDQVGNRAFGERLAALVGPDLDAVASVLVACSPFLPLLFQGQEWGETRPFLYFTDHEPGLAASVLKGRREEFGAFGWDEVPDPNDPASFERSKLDWSRAGGETLALWTTLLRLRREVPALGNCRRDLAAARVDPERRLVVLERGDPSGSRAVVAANLGEGSQHVPVDTGKLRLRVATRPCLPSGDLSGASAAVWTT
jgi:maltooligosyltrehalose trehalohydrolase